jgi:hypothetical protein
MIATRKFKDASIASHALRFGGSVAGKVDQCDANLIRGWIYDASRPDSVLELEILVDGEKVHRVAADVYRKDIASLLKDHGVHGFECTVNVLAIPSSRERIVKIRLGDRPRQVLGTFRIEPINVFASLPSTDISQVLDDRLAHIFNHITAAHEDGLRRFDKLQAMIGELQSIQNNQMMSGSAASSPNNSLLYDMPCSAITGVGQFRKPNSIAEEMALFQARLEQALLKARYLS